MGYAVQSDVEDLLSIIIVATEEELSDPVDPREVVLDDDWVAAALTDADREVDSFLKTVTAVPLTVSVPNEVVQAANRYAVATMLESARLEYLNTESTQGAPSRANAYRKRAEALLLRIIENPGAFGLEDYPTNTQRGKIITNINASSPPRHTQLNSYKKNRWS